MTNPIFHVLNRIVFSVLVCLSVYFCVVLVRDPEANLFPGFHLDVLMQRSYLLGSREIKMIFQGKQRSFLIHHVHAERNKKPHPLVLVLHASDSNAYEIEEFLGMNHEISRRKWMVAYPNGTGDEKRKIFNWNAGNCCGAAFQNQIDDVGFLHAVIAKIKTKYPVDPARIYVTGFSNGGMMAYRAACGLSDEIAAVAPVAGALDDPDCRPARPISVIAFHGEWDRTILYHGGVSPIDLEKSYDQSVDFAMKFWSKQNGCLTTPQEIHRGSLTRVLYSGCREGTEVMLWSFARGGHDWPGLKSGLTFDRLPSDSENLSATKEILNFFEKHPRQS